MSCPSDKVGSRQVRACKPGPVTWLRRRLAEELDIDPKIDVNQVGDSLDINSNIYALNARAEAVNASGSTLEFPGALAKRLRIRGERGPNVPRSYLAFVQLSGSRLPEIGLQCRRLLMVRMAHFATTKPDFALRNGTRHKGVPYFWRRKDGLYKRF